MPSSLAHSLLHVTPILIRCRGLLSGMPSTVAPPAGRNDVGLRISSTIAFRREMFGCGLVVHGLTQGQAVTLGKEFRRTRPHGLAAIRAEAMLLFEGMGALSRN
jgi:hypothetical protein